MISRDPAINNVALSLLTVQTVGVLEVKVTGSPELAVASSYGAQRTWTLPGMVEAIRIRSGKKRVHTTTV